MLTGVSALDAIRPARGVILSLLLACGAASAAEAQQFGQWWWVATAQATGNRVKAGSRDGGSSEFGSDRLRIGFGIRGFIVHPAIGKFRVDLDASASEVTGGRSVDLDRLGFDTQLSLLPYSYFPVSLYASRGFFGYGEPAEGSAFTLRSAPDRHQLFGGLITSQWKALRGLRFRFLDHDVEFLAHELGRELRQERELLWSRHIGQVNHSAKLSRRYLEFAMGDFAAEDLIMSVEQHGKIAPQWHWRNSLGGTRRTLPRRPESGTTETLGLLSQFSRIRENTDQLRFVFNVNAAESLGQEVRTSSVSGEYAWNRGERWTIAPTARYSVTRLDDARITASGAGLAVAWKWQRSPRSLTVFNSLGYLATASDQPGAGAQESDALTYEFRVSAAASPPQGLRRQLELSYLRNEFSVTESVDPDSLDFGLVVNRDLLADVLSTRLTFARSLGRGQASANTYWTRRESSPRARSSLGRDLSGQPLAQLGRGFESETLSQVFQINRHPFDLSTSLASARVSGPSSPEQRSDLLTGSLRWKLRRVLRLHLRYRSEERDAALAPRIDFRRLEAGMDFSLGLLTIQASYFETVNNVGPTRQRTNHGFRWRVTRRAAGLLPIVSAPKRRGVIQ